MDLTSMTSPCIGYGVNDHLWPMISAQNDPFISLFLPIFVTHLMLHGCICLCFAEYSSKSKIPGKEGKCKEICFTGRYRENRLAQKGAKKGPTS